MTDRCAIVTGASRGLGCHFALILARAAAQVTLAARGMDRLQEVVKEIKAFNGHAVAVRVDVTDGKGVHPQLDIYLKPTTGLTRSGAHFRKFAKTPVSGGQNRHHLGLYPHRSAADVAEAWQIFVSSWRLKPPRMLDRVCNGLNV